MRLGSLRILVMLYLLLPDLCDFITPGVQDLFCASFAEPALHSKSTPIHFVDVTKELGVTFRHTDGRSGQKYFVEPLGSGVALFDYDNDGALDIYFVNGCDFDKLNPTDLPPPPLLPSPKVGEGKGVRARNALYRNDGERFTEVTDEAGVGDSGYGLGCCVGDYNNDGFDDLYVTNFGPNVLYRNNGDGTFTDVTAQTGVGGEELSSGCAFADYDNDGFLDLYVANYVQFRIEENPKCSRQGVLTYCTPEAFQGAADRLYHNNCKFQYIHATNSSQSSAESPSQGY